MNLIRRINNNVELARLYLTQNPDDAYARAMTFEVLTTRTTIQCWQQTGTKTFILNKNLIEAFQNTDIPLEAYPNEFQYPFDCFLIESDVPLFVTSYEMGSKNVYSILYMHRKAIPEGQLQIITDTLEKPKEGAVIEWDSILTAFFPKDEFIECIFVYMKDTRTLNENINLKKHSIALTELEQVDARNMMNIFYNTVLYINDPDRKPEETEVHGSRKMSTGEENPTVRMPYIVLSPPKHYKNLSEGTGRTIDKRFIVRGHWRNQACGEKYSLHKRIWIHPFYKGPELAEVVNRPYLVK